MATTRTGVTVRQLQRILYQASRLSSTSSTSSSNVNRANQCATSLDSPNNANVVTYARGKHIKLAGSNTKLLDFASSNVIGAKTNDDVTAAEATAAGKFGLSRQFNRSTEGQDLQGTVMSKISNLHGKTSSSLAMGSFASSVTCWLSQLRTDDLIIVDDELQIDTKGFQVQRESFSSILDLISQFEKLDDKAIGHRLVLVNLGSSADDIVKVKAACELADKFKAVVVACDPHGIMLMRNIVGDFQDNLDVLKKPLVIHSSFDSFIGHSTMSYVSGPKGFIQWYEQCLNESQKLIPVYMAAKVNKILSASDELAGRLCQSLFSSVQLKHALWEAGVQVQCHDVSLFLGLEDESCLQCARQQLIEEGFHVGVVRRTNKSGLKVNISPDHTQSDIQRLTHALERAIKNPGNSQERLAATANGSSIGVNTAPVMLEVSSIRRTEIGQSILQDIDISVPIQMNMVDGFSVVRSDPDAGSSDKFFADNSPMFSSAILQNPKFDPKDMSLLENFYFEHLNQKPTSNDNPNDLIA